MLGMSYVPKVQPFGILHNGFVFQIWQTCLVLQQLHLAAPLMVPIL